jgi:hypothetical protein
VASASYTTVEEASIATSEEVAVGTVTEEVVTSSACYFEEGLN